mmetsp:Transcript_33865/g.30669  ORF Transcript_33865/g.30669 Transcript_33865/m.30669 type:complete len:89 (+) Transcript_33865:31-297(+)
MNKNNNNFLKPDDPHFITDPSQSSLPTLQNNLSKNNLQQISLNQSSQNANNPNDETSNDAESNILVAIRVRPIIQKEIITGEFDIIVP